MKNENNFKGGTVYLIVGSGKDVFKVKTHFVTLNFKYAKQQFHCSVGMVLEALTEFTKNHPSV